MKKHDFLICIVGSVAAILIPSYKLVGIGVACRSFGFTKLLSFRLAWPYFGQQHYVWILCEQALVLLLGMLLAAFPVLPEAVAQDQVQLERIAKLIFQNECAAKEACLTSWNKGEDFASLGIGHFIWYPQGVSESDKHFSESFPRLIRFMRPQGVEIPPWIQVDKGCP